MNKNDLVNVKITDLGTDGEGIGKIDGFTLFVKGAVPGDYVRAHILKSKKTYAYAKIEEILAPSPDRVEPKCPVANKCGGCRIQQLSYDKQLELKSKKVKDCLVRLGGVDAVELEGRFEGIIGMEEPWHYRNKAQYPIAVDKDGKVRIGCYAYHSHTIIEKYWLKRLEKTKILCHIYVLLIVAVSFVFFDATSIPEAGKTLAAMFGASGLPAISTEAVYYLRSYGFLFIIAIIGATPLPATLCKKAGEMDVTRRVRNILEPIFILLLLFSVTGYIVDGSFNPFLYFRF